MFISLLGVQSPLIWIPLNRICGKLFQELLLHDSVTLNTLLIGVTSELGYFYVPDRYQSSNIWCTNYHVCLMKQFNSNPFIYLEQAANPSIDMAFPMFLFCCCEQIKVCEDFCLWTLNINHNLNSQRNFSRFVQILFWKFAVLTIFVKLNPLWKYVHLAYLDSPAWQSREVKESKNYITSKRFIFVSLSQNFWAKNVIFCVWFSQKFSIFGEIVYQKWILCLISFLNMCTSKGHWTITDNILNFMGPKFWAWKNQTIAYYHFLALPWSH